MTSLGYGPTEASKVLEMQADMINCPRIGTDDNFAYPTMQFNTSPAESADSGMYYSYSFYLVSMLK
jgi:hypothetical protein